MITYAERVCFHARHLETLSRVQAMVARVSPAWGNELRCHELARAVHRVLNDVATTVIDGKCGPVEHSWLWINDGAILDPYSPGRLPAIQIIDPIVGVAYRAGAARDDIRQVIVEKLVIEMRTEPSAKKVSAVDLSTGPVNKSSKSVD